MSKLKALGSQNVHTIKVDFVELKRTFLRFQVLILVDRLQDDAKKKFNTHICSEIEYECGKKKLVRLKTFELFFALI